MKINPEYGKIILRISLALVFLWFGISQISSPSDWVSFVPDYLASSSRAIVLANGFFESILGVMLLLGLYTRFSSIVLSAHLFIIALSMGFTAIAVRDFGLALATLSIFFLGADKFCLDRKL